MANINIAPKKRPPWGSHDWGEFSMRVDCLGSAIGHKLRSALEEARGYHRLSMEQDKAHGLPHEFHERMEELYIDLLSQLKRVPACPEVWDIRDFEKAHPLMGIKPD